MLMPVVWLGNIENYRLAGVGGLGLYSCVLQKTKCLCKGIDSGERASSVGQDFPVQVKPRQNA